MGEDSELKQYLKELFLIYRDGKLAESLGIPKMKTKLD
jgi:hypothetical protein